MLNLPPTVTFLPKLMRNPVSMPRSSQVIDQLHFNLPGMRGSIPFSCTFYMCPAHCVRYKYA